MEHIACASLALVFGFAMFMTANVYVEHRRSENYVFPTVQPFAIRHE